MSKIESDKLLLTSNFFSIQGEGKSSGVPAYFIRLGVCNLSCGMSRKWLNNLINLHEASPETDKIADGEIFKGDLHQQDLATWTCDSTSQWALRGENKDFQYLIDAWKNEGIFKDILDGVIHLIWTGGEPTIPQHQEAIANFLNYLEENWQSNLEMSELHSANKNFIIGIKDNKVTKAFYVPFNEIETNGTYYIEDKLFSQLHQINCSPKLSNSGMTAKQRIVPEAIERIKSHRNYQFKFVISTEEDIKEMFETFIEPFKIPIRNVYCMPGMDSQEQFFERTRWCLEMGKKYRFNALTRLHIGAWDKTLNV